MDGFSLSVRIWNTNISLEVLQSSIALTGQHLCLCQRLVALFDGDLGKVTRSSCIGDGRQQRAALKGAIADIGHRFRQIEICQQGASCKGSILNGRYLLSDRNTADLAASAEGGRTNAFYAVGDGHALDALSLVTF